MNIFKSLINSLKSSITSPSKEWQEKILNKIRSMEGYETKPTTNFNILFNPFYMKKALSGLLALMVVVVMGGYFYTQNTPYAQAMKHLKNASNALEQLKNPGTSSQLGFVPTAYADETVVEEAPVEEAGSSEEAQTSEETVALIETVENETDEAVEAAEEIDDPEDTAEVLGETDTVQSETVEVLTDIIATSDDETVVEAATITVENTDASNEVVEEARNEVEISAVTNKKAKIAIKEKIRERRETRRAERTEKIEEIVANLQSSYDTMDPAMQKKYDAIKEVLANCKAEDATKCKIGKAKGLATALQAKARNEARQEERVKHLEEFKALKAKNAEELKTLKEEQKEEMKNQKEETKTIKETGDKEALEEQKEEVKQLREEQKEEVKQLREEQKEEVKTIKEENKAEVKYLKGKAEKVKSEEPEDTDEPETETPAPTVE